MRLEKHEDRFRANAVYYFAVELLFGTALGAAG